MLPDSAYWKDFVINPSYDFKGDIAFVQYALFLVYVVLSK